MKINIIPIISFLFCQIIVAQNFQSEFQKYCETNDTINQLKVLQKWYKNSPKDPELYTSYFNYHFSKSKKEVLSLTDKQPNGEGLVLTDSLNQTTGFIGSQILYNEAELNKAFIKIDEGIKLFPNRLDMRFGKIYVLGETSKWEKFTSEIIKTIQYSTQNNNEWTWTYDEKKEGGSRDFLLSIQSYQLQLYNTQNDDLLINMRQIANEVLKYYPNHIESLSNLSITYLINGEYDKGIAPLLKAEKINPEDYIVLSNIAHGYKLKGEIKKSIEYYKKVLKYGDARAIEYAKAQLKELK